MKFMTQAIESLHNSRFSKEDSHKFLKIITKESISCSLAALVLAKISLLI
jgi:hypothetical protein